MRTAVIVNPASGSVRSLADITAAIRHHPAVEDADIRLSQGPGAALELAREAVESGIRRILATGGDGTLNEVVNGVGPHRDDVVVGLLPLGTGNDFARATGMPLALEAALDALAEAVPRPTDLVRVTGSVERYFVNASAGGFSGEVDEDMTPDVKASWGPLAYARSAVRVLPDAATYRARLTVDDGPERPVELLNLVVANGRTVAGGIPVAPAARLDDGAFDVMMVGAGELRELAALAPLLLVGQHGSHELVEQLRARRLTVEAEPPMPFNLDGELLGETPLIFELLPGAVRMLVGPGGEHAYG